MDHHNNAMCRERDGDGDYFEFVKAKFFKLDKHADADAFLVNQLIDKTRQHSVRCSIVS